MTFEAVIPFSRSRFVRGALAAFAAAALLCGAPAWARSADTGDSGGVARFIVELRDPPLAAYDGGKLTADGPGGSMRIAATAPESTGEKRLNTNSSASRDYLGYLAERQTEFVSEIESLLGRNVSVSHRYGVATNGLALILAPDEVERVRGLPGVRSVEKDRVYRLQTYASAEWLGAGLVWDGATGQPAARGEGAVVAVIDTGINWEHPSFSDQSEDGYVYTNPYGRGLGLCSDREVLCNDKLVGVYDFVEDDPSTPDYEEENTKGRDNNGHGSHTASIAAGATLQRYFESVNRTLTLSGVAPRANIVSYRVCYMGEPSSDESEGCQGSAILAAIDQAILDGVDVINYSIGGDPWNPWSEGSADRAFLNARGAGIVVTSSAGNEGPNPGTVTSPALAPWIVAVGNASHNQITGTTLQNLSGGGLPAPAPMTGASLVGGTNKLPIVHARDFGYPLCGAGPAELGRDCSENTGASNPWAGEKPFTGYIVVCDRGTYGRIEKGKNVLLAGAAGYVLANAEDSYQDIVADSHCLPATHLGRADGDVLREWLASGAGHGAQISEVASLESDAAADQLAFSSSRGPAGESLSYLANLLKPNLIAPGINILGAYYTDNFAYLTGTSMASPQVAGAAALVKSVHPGWGANEIISALETTATQELAKDDFGDPATTEQVGAGRPRIGEAVNAGFYLDVTQSEFFLSGPSSPIDLRDLNLPGLVDAECKSVCTFTRSLTDLVGGAEWSTEAVGFPEGTVVSVTPASFTLGPGQTRNVVITVDVTNAGIYGDWVSGKVRFTAEGVAEQFLTVSVKSFGGQLPGVFAITDDRDSGWRTFALGGLVALPNATFLTGGLVKPETRTVTLTEDPTNDDPYNGDGGTSTSWYSLEDGALWLYAETPEFVRNLDIDLFVGRDDNGNGQADASEELCGSKSEDSTERCDLYDLRPGDYWVLVQNWSGVAAGGDDVTLVSAAVEPGAGSGLAASGPGIVGADDTFSLRVSWEGLNALPGETWLGAVGVGSTRDTPNDIGVVPVRFVRNGIAPAATYPLMNGRAHGLALAAGGMHDRAFIDVPPGTASLTVSAEGATAAQSDRLRIDLVRLDFADALVDVPHAVAPGGQAVVVSASGGGGAGPVATIGGGVEPGRWYAVLRNEGVAAAAVTVRADVSQSGPAVDLHPGLWMPSQRPDLRQGYEVNWSEGENAPYFLLWYTYDESGRPTWFFASETRGGQNVWTADLMRGTNDGAAQDIARVGSASVTMIARDEALFSFTLFGQSGTEPIMPQSALTCPEVNGAPASYTGHWFRGVPGLGGSSLIVNAAVQGFIHYLYDATGSPRWLVAQDPENPAPDATTIPVLQFSGYCALCDPVDVSYSLVGQFERQFSSETTGSWGFDFDFDPPLTGSVERTESIVKLSHRMECQ